MQGDFSRWTYDRSKHYSRVLSLQGRVSLDADFNEGFEIQLQALRRLTVDLIEEHAGRGTGFEIGPATPPGKDFSIAAGSYYVNGIRVTNDAAVNYSAQPYVPKPPELPAGRLLVYLDVWERFLTYVEDEDPLEIGQTIREVALNGPDTAGRSKIVWQVRVLDVSNNEADFKANYGQFLATLAAAKVIDDKKGMAAIRARKPKAEELPCETQPDARYRGPENQLYRVEIHDSGSLGLANADGTPVEATGTWKWSRENASVIFPIRALEGTFVTLETLGRDSKLGLKTGDLVEVVDDDYVLENRAEPLLMVKSIDAETYTVELSAPPASTVGTVATKHPVLRRWEGTAKIERSLDPETGGYLPLEDGVEVRFSDGSYRTGDYWIAPARTATGDVEWPGPASSPREIPPHGIQHSYAPLAIVQSGAAGAAGLVVSDSLRRIINQLWS